MGLRQRQVSIWLPRVDVLEKVNLVCRLLRRAAQRADTLPHKVWFRMVTWTVDNGHGDQGNERKKGKRPEGKPATATTAACLGQSRSPIHSAHSNLGHSALAASRECTKGRVSSQEANSARHQSFAVAKTRDSTPSALIGECNVGIHCQYLCVISIPSDRLSTFRFYERFETESQSLQISTHYEVRSSALAPAVLGCGQATEH